MIGIVCIALALVVLLVGLDFLGRPRDRGRYRDRRGLGYETYDERPNVFAPAEPERHDAMRDAQVLDRRPPKNHARVRR